MRSALLFLLLLITPTSFADQIIQAGPILSDSPVIGERGEKQPVVIDVVLHDRDAILNMLKRAESLAMTPNPSERPREISLVLHGQEIENFRISEYANNRDIVDLAAKLDAFNVIDVKMCGTMMEMLKVDKKDIPAFIEIVPFGPAEVDQLESKGFLRL